MLNLYSIILGLFAVGGFCMALWAWLKIAAGRKTLNWPKVEGVIETSALTADAAPHIVFGYTVAAQQYRRTLETPGASDVTPETGKRYVEKYPAGTKVQVFYNPDNVNQATLTPGPASENWFLFSVGLGAMLLGVAFLFFNR